MSATIMPAGHPSAPGANSINRATGVGTGLKGQPDKTDLEIAEDLLVRAAKVIDAQLRELEVLRPIVEAHNMMKQLMNERRPMGFAPAEEPASYEIDRFVKMLQEKKIELATKG